MPLLSLLVVLFERPEGLFFCLLNFAEGTAFASWHSSFVLCPNMKASTHQQYNETELHDASCSFQKGEKHDACQDLSFNTCCQASCPVSQANPQAPSTQTYQRTGVFGSGRLSSIHEGMLAASGQIPSTQVAGRGADHHSLKANWTALRLSPAMTICA